MLAEAPDSVGVALALADAHEKTGRGSGSRPGGDRRETHLLEIASVAEGLRALTRFGNTVRSHLGAVDRLLYLIAGGWLAVLTRGAYLLRRKGWI